MDTTATTLTMQDMADRVPDSKILGDKDHPIKRFVHPSEVTEASDLCLLMSPPALGYLQAEESKHRCAVVDRRIAESPEHTTILGRLDAYLVVDRPRYALACLSPMFRQRSPAPLGVHPSAIVDEDAVLGEGISVGPGVWIGSGAQIGDRCTILANASICEGSSIGEDCLIFPGVYIGHHVEIGKRVIVHPNASLGGDGFAFESAVPNGAEDARRVRTRIRGQNKRLERIESLGSLRIEDDVEIGSCATIDRSTLGKTVIGRGTKIDNLVQIGHGNVIGEDVLLCAQVGLAGSSKIGDGAVLAGKVGVADHRNIGANSVLMAKSGVTKDIPPGEVYYGMPARPVRETLRQYSLTARLEEMNKRIADLEAQLAQSPRA